MARHNNTIAATLLVSAGALGVLGTTSSTQAQERPKADQAGWRLREQER